MSNDDIKYSWTSFPLLDKPKHTILVVVVTLIITYVLYQLAIVKWDQPLYYVLGLFIFFIGIFPYFVPTKYIFFEDGFTVQYPVIKVKKNYSDYRCFYVDKNGIMLSTFKTPRRLDAFRGQSIRFSKNSEEKPLIINFLKEKIGKQY